MIERLKILRAMREQFQNGAALSNALDTDPALKSEIDTLTNVFLKRKLGSCKSCYMDAFIELVTLPIEIAMQRNNTEYELRAGVLLKDTKNFDYSKNMTNANITEELALYHLRTNPSCRGLFSKLPADIDERIAGTSAQVPEQKSSSKKNKKHKK